MYGLPKCMIFKALKIAVKIFKQNLHENYAKSTKIAFTACKFSKFFRRSMSPVPRLSCFSCSFKLILSKENTLEKMWK